MKTAQSVIISWSVLHDPVIRQQRNCTLKDYFTASQDTRFVALEDFRRKVTVFECPACKARDEARVLQCSTKGRMWIQQRLRSKRAKTHACIYHYDNENAKIVLKSWYFFCVFHAAARSFVVALIFIILYLHEGIYLRSEFTIFSTILVFSFS